MKLDQHPTPRDAVLIVAYARAIDGDTITGLVHLGMDTFTRCTMRLKGFFAPEINGRTPTAGLAARDHLDKIVRSHTVSFPLRGARKDKYGRWLIALQLDGHFADPFETLGHFQLTEAAHQHDLEFAKLAAHEKGGAL